jgi:hypothetical protein
MHNITFAFYRSLNHLNVATMLAHVTLVVTLLVLPNSCGGFQVLSPILSTNAPFNVPSSLTMMNLKNPLDISGLLQPLADQSAMSLLGINTFDSTIVTLAWAMVGVTMTAIEIANFQRLSQTDYRPSAAWTRAMMYFSVCNMVACSSGTTRVLLEQPLWTSAQIANPIWQWGAAACTIYILLAYWGLWSRMTLTFDRQLYLGACLVFGLLWGLSTGQLLTTFYHLFNGGGLVTLTGWSKYAAAYACMGGWQYLIQDYWWDIYISPEHDTPQSIIVKTAVCHIPNVAICLAFLNQYDNYALFVLWQTMALVAASIFQKFPAPWAQAKKFDAPMTQPGIFGLPRGLGYIEESDVK